MESCYTLLAIAQYHLFPDALSSQCHATLFMYVNPPQYSWIVYISIFILTCILEAPFYLYLMKDKFELKKNVRYMILLNLATHPFVIWILSASMARYSLSNATYILTGEIFAPFLEALLLIWWLKQRSIPSFLISIIANLFSWNFGLFLLYLFNS